MVCNIENIVLMEIKDRVADLPRLLNISVQEFISTIGISRTSFGKLKSGKSKPSFDTIHAILDNYSINPNWLILGKEGPLLSSENNKGLGDDKYEKLSNEMEHLRKEIDKIKSKQ